MNESSFYQNFCICTHSLTGVKFYCETQLKHEIKSNGFQYRRFQSPPGHFMELYKNPFTALRNQFAINTKDEFLSDPVSERGYSHLMNSQIRICATRAVKEYMKKCAGRDISWKYMKSDVEKSFSVAIQLFSGKSQVSLRDAGMSFYPFQLTAFNFLEKICEVQKSEKQSLFAWSPVLPRRANIDVVLAILNPCQKTCGLSELLQSFQKSVKCALVKLHSTAHSVFTATLSAGHNILYTVG